MTQSSNCYVKRQYSGNRLNNLMLHIIKRSWNVEKIFLTAKTAKVSQSPQSKSIDI